MKVYVHIECSTPCAVICNVNGEDRMESLLQLFTERYAAKSGNRLEAALLTLQEKNGNALPPKKRISSMLNDLDDVFVRVPGEEKPTTTRTTVPVASTSYSHSQPAQSKPKTTDNTVDQNSVVFTELISMGEKEEEKQYYRKASRLYQQVLEACPDHKVALVHLMKLWNKVGRPRVAAKWCEKCIGRYSDDLYVLMAAGPIKLALGEKELAIELYNRAMSIAKKKPTKEFPIQDVEIAAASAMYSVGGVFENTAVQLVMSVVEPEKKHFEGLLLYAKIAYHRNLAEDAVQVLLRLIMQKQEHEEIKRYLADCFEKPGVLRVVMNELKSGPGLSSAYAFIAARIKDYGAIHPAIQLYEKAVEIAPEDPSIALNYIHILELIMRNDAIILYTQQFLKTSKISLIRSLENRDIGRILDNLPSFGQADAYGWLSPEEWTSNAQIEEIEDIVETVEFRDVQLDMLATLFTIVKVLFIGGALERAKKAVELIKPCCKASEDKLHETTIRNEAAYFNCIRQILTEHPPPAATNLHNLQPLYLCGDSHCLSGAWQHVQLHGKTHLLIPKLVTGCKVWHLRPESRFYPKKGFETTMESLPKKSAVILNFGEIDCRTGIGLAVEKCKYDSQAAAIKKTILIYVQVIKDLVREYEFEIYVHPVPPALEVTRPIVIAYNKALKTAIEALARTDEYKNKVYWLDFFDQLLSPDGRHLKPEMEFDDTHLSPLYTNYLREALIKCEPTAD